MLDGHRTGGAEESADREAPLFDPVKSRCLSLEAEKFRFGIISKGQNRSRK